MNDFPEFIDLKVICKNCNNSTTKAVKVINSDKWSKDSSRLITAHSWCIKCLAPIIYTYNFSEKKGEIKAKVKRYLNSSQIFKHKINKRVGITIKPQMNLKK